MESMTENNSFPVRAIASATLHYFIGYEATHQLFKGALEDLLKTVLDILDMYFTNGLIDTLKELV